MRHEVRVRFGANEEAIAHCSAPWPLEQARTWLDQEFVRLECVPTRASGKVLFADKILAIADAVGAAGFADVAWAGSYAAAVTGAVGRSPLRVNLETSALD
jgi:hypothetical protein